MALEYTIRAEQEQIVFATPHGVVFLTSDHVDLVSLNDRERAVAKALLRLALDRVEATEARP